MSFKFRDEKVSYHAVWRYAQRVLCMPEIEGLEELSDPQRALAYAEAAGCTILDIKKLIYTRALAAAAEHGFRKVTIGEFELVLGQPGGVVITVLNRTLPRSRKTSTIMSDRELRTKLNKVTRRAIRAQLDRTRCREQHNGESTENV